MMPQHKYEEVNVKHVLCPHCDGSGMERTIDLSCPPVKGREVVDGYYAEICSLCRGIGWIHIRMPENEER